MQFCSDIDQVYISQNVIVSVFFVVVVQNLDIQFGH